MSLELDIIKQSDLQAPAYYQGLADGRAEARVEAIAEGVAYAIRRQLEIRFGPFPDWAVSRVNESTTDERDRFAVQLLTAPSIEDVLR